MPSAVSSISWFSLFPTANHLKCLCSIMLYAGEVLRPWTSHTPSVSSPSSARSATSRFLPCERGVTPAKKTPGGGQSRRRGGNARRVRPGRHIHLRAVQHHHPGVPHAGGILLFRVALSMLYGGTAGTKTTPTKKARRWNGRWSASSRGASRCLWSRRDIGRHALQVEGRPA